MVIKREKSNWFNSGKYANCYGWAKRDKIEREKEKKRPMVEMTRKKIVAFSSVRTILNVLRSQLKLCAFHR